MGKRQHFKGKKRMKSWHRGRSEARLWRGSDLPDLGTGADPTAGEPAPLHRRRRHRQAVPTRGGRVINDATRAALDRARAVLAEAPDVDHDHNGPDPCPRCGGLPAEPAPLTSWHPKRIDSNEETQ